MPRPMMQHGVGQLETLFASSTSNLKVLKQLENELQFRQVPRALALLEQVQAAIQAINQIPAPITTGSVPSEQPDLWTRPQVLQSRASPPSMGPYPSSQPAEPALDPRPLTTATPRPTTPSMTFDDACKLLGVLPSSPWDEVEQARRQLVQVSHPDRLAALTPERQDHARAQARRVNAAYSKLSATRGG